MKAIINYFSLVFSHIVNILDIRPFQDFKITYLQLLLTCIVIRYLFKFIFGGFKEVENGTDFMTSKIISNASKGMDNKNRKAQINNGYEPKHAKE